MTEAKKRPPAIHAGVRRLVDALLAQSKYNLQAAAAEAGLTTYRAREHLMKPHVLRFLREQKQALLEEICATNPATLAEIKASSGNDMARVNAVKALEQIKSGVVEETGVIAKQTPGLVIVIEKAGQPDRIIAPPMPASMIDVTPERDRLGQGL
jgi:hypothetical protein